jgi:membrane associated rhomboid family serine protease
MQVITERGYTEELTMHGATAAQYMVAAQMTLNHLQWPITAITGNSITCITPGYDYPATFDTITITINPKTATLLTTPGHADETQLTQNINLYKQVVAQVIAAQEKAHRNLLPSRREKYGALLISKSYLVTPIIVYANVLVFLLMVLAGLSPISPTAQSLFEWGGNFRPAVADGQWWRLVTYIFLHGGFMHLFMNTFALLYIGMHLEPLMGRFRFASAYLLTGVCAGLLSITIHTGSVGVGASGAIFGMFGVFLSMLTTSHISRTLRKTMLRSLLFFIVLNLLYGLQGNTDNAAHIGGLLSGIAIGYAYYPGIAAKATLRKQALTTALIAAGVIAVAVVVMSW